jgi:large subunit ribosomal protein L30
VVKATAKAKGGKQLRVTLLKSRFGRTPGHAECAQGLGLRRRHQTVVVNDTPENRGMIAKIGYMLHVEEA